jgi:hypothetical protein
MIPKPQEGLGNEIFLFLPGKRKIRVPVCPSIHPSRHQWSILNNNSIPGETIAFRDRPSKQLKTEIGIVNF